MIGQTLSIDPNFKCLLLNFVASYEVPVVQLVVVDGELEVIHSYQGGVQLYRRSDTKE